MWLAIPVWQVAGCFALLASVTFPVGALCGVLSCDRHRKLNDELLSAFLAIGAGSLIFAVSVEVYAEGLDSIEYTHPRYPIRTAAYIVQVIFAIAGALLYIGLERSVRNRSIPLWPARGRTAPPVASPRAAEARSVTVSVTASANGPLEGGKNAPTRERAARESDADTDEPRACTVPSPCVWTVKEEDTERECLLREVCEELHEDEVRRTDSKSDAELEEEEALPGVSALTEEHTCRSTRDATSRGETLNKEGPAARDAMAPNGIGTASNKADVRGFLVAILVYIQSYAPRLQLKYSGLRYSGSLIDTQSDGQSVDAEDIEEGGSLERTRQAYRIGQREADNLDLALVLWTSQLLDAIPEAMMIGFRTAGDTLSWAFILALCISNFPESFCGGYLMRKEGVTACSTLLYWFAVSCFTAAVSICTAVLTPSHSSSLLRLFDAAVQGVAAGAMLALATASMLPAAYEARGVSSGLYCVVGFLLSLSTRLLFGLLSGVTPLGEAESAVTPIPHIPGGIEGAVAGDVA